MQKNGRDRKPADSAKAEKAGAPEIKTTPEMVPAGSDVILEMIGPADDDRPFYDTLEVAHQVFSAMMAENLK